MRRRLLRDQSGLGALEFALIAPVFVGLVVGITQLGALYFANADLRNAVAAGARTAQIFPRPDDSTVRTAITDRLQRVDRTKLASFTIDYRDPPAVPYAYADIVVSYQVPLNFVIYKPPAVTLVERRRVYLQPV